MKEVSKKFTELKNSGIDQEILIIYLSSKTGLGKSQIKLLLFHQEEFYNKLISEEVAKSI